MLIISSIHLQESIPVKFGFYLNGLLRPGLPIDDIGRASYVPLINPDDYYTTIPHKSPRHEILNNLWGKNNFCPFIHKSTKLRSLENLCLENEISQLTRQFDPRFLLNDYRDFQNYTGEEPSLGKMLVHFILPKPEDIPNLMNGLLTCASNMFYNDIPASITTAVLAFGFIFLHPFWDGNGRLHRFLIHYALHKCGFSPKGMYSLSLQ